MPVSGTTQERYPQMNHYSRGENVAIIKVDIHPEFIQMYQQAHYPLGKSRRGFKKWIKRKIIEALTAFVRDEDNK